MHIAVQIVALVVCFLLAKHWIDRSKGYSKPPKGKRGRGQQQSQQYPVANGWHSVEIEKARLQAQREQRESYERIVREKLEVMKTALSMGYNEKELEGLDARLEKLIGGEKLASILKNGEAPMPDADMTDTDLESEVERLHQAKSAQG